MRWVLRLIATGDDAHCLSTDLLEVCRPEGLGDVANLGLTLPEAKQLLASVQRAVVTSQVDSHGQLRPCCRSCSGRCHLKGSREDSERHLEVRVGNVETTSGGRQVFGAVAKAGTDISALVRQSLRAVGRTDDTEVTAFTDGCPGLRSILVDAGVTTPPILDWFHIAVRMQHATQTASGLPTDDAGKMQAKIVIVEEVGRLRWRIWNGKAKNAERSIDRVRKVMHAYKGERGHNMRTAPSHRLWHALLDVDGYLRGQSSWLVNYAKWYRADLHVGTSITEGTANFLVNRLTNKSQLSSPGEFLPDRAPEKPTFRYTGGTPSAA